MPSKSKNREYRQDVVLHLKYWLKLDMNLAMSFINFYRRQRSCQEEIRYVKFACGPFSRHMPSAAHYMVCGSYTHE